MINSIVILGAGAYGEVVSELAEDCGYTVKAYFDDDPDKQRTSKAGVHVAGTISNFMQNNDLDGMHVAVAIGNNVLRSELLNTARSRGAYTPNLIHNSAVISKTARIGAGVLIQANAIVWAGATIEDNCIISAGAVVSHHAVLREGSFVSILGAVGAGVKVGPNAFIGMGATIIPEAKSIGRNVTVGAGSTVVRCVPDGVIVAGVPARLIK